MNQTLLAVSVVCAAAAIILQLVVLYAFYKVATQSAQRMHDTLARMEQKTDPILTMAQSILQDAQPKISAITTNLAEATAAVRANVNLVAETTTEIVEKARLQAVRLDEMVTSTLEKVEQTTDFLQHSVVTPVRRAHAVVQAVGAGLSFFKTVRSKKRKAGTPGDEEEEMFI